MVKEGIFERIFSRTSQRGFAMEEVTMRQVFL